MVPEKVEIGDFETKISSKEEKLEVMENAIKVRVVRPIMFKDKVFKNRNSLLT